MVVVVSKPNCWFFYFSFRERHIALDSIHERIRLRLNWREQSVKNIILCISRKTFIQPRSYALISCQHLLIPRMRPLMHHQTHKAFQVFRFAQHQRTHSVFHTAVAPLDKAVAWISIPSKSSIHDLEKFHRKRFCFFPIFCFF